MSASIRACRVLAAGAAAALTAGLVTSFAVSSAQAAPASSHHSVTKVDDKGGQGKDDPKGDDHGKHGRGHDDQRHGAGGDDHGHDGAGHR